jgi:hypothetical protein
MSIFDRDGYGGQRVSFGDGAEAVLLAIYASCSFDLGMLVH